MGDNIHRNIIFTRNHTTSLANELGMFPWRQTRLLAYEMMSLNLWGVLSFHLVLGWLVFFCRTLSFCEIPTELCTRPKTPHRQSSCLPSIWSLHHSTCFSWFISDTKALYLVFFAVHPSSICALFTVLTLMFKVGNFSSMAYGSISPSSPALTIKNDTGDWSS